VRYGFGVSVIGKALDKPAKESLSLDKLTDEKQSTVRRQLAGVKSSFNSPTANLLKL